MAKYLINYYIISFSSIIQKPRLLMFIYLTIMFQLMKIMLAILLKYILQPLALQLEILALNMAIIGGKLQIKIVIVSKNLLKGSSRY